MTDKEKEIVHHMWLTGRKMRDHLADYRAKLLKYGTRPDETLPTRLLNMFDRFSELDEKLCEMIGPPE